MFKRLRLAALALMIVATGPASAATITTQAFVAIITPTLDFLDQADALALAMSDRGPVRAFATQARTGRARALHDLATWQQAEAAEQARETAGSTLDHLGPVAGILQLPYNAVADTSVLLGRPATPLPSADAERAQGARDLAQLQTLQGPAFDSNFIALGIAALRRLESAYKAFILNGDDPILRRLAVDDLPRVEGLLARARRL